MPRNIFPTLLRWPATMDVSLRRPFYVEGTKSAGIIICLSKGNRLYSKSISVYCAAFERVRTHRGMTCYVYRTSRHCLMHVHRSLFARFVSPHPITHFGRTCCLFTRKERDVPACTRRRRRCRIGGRRGVSYPPLQRDRLQGCGVPCVSLQRTSCRTIHHAEGY